MNRGPWNSLRHLTLERLIPERRAWSGEELRMKDNEARALFLQKTQPHSFLPHHGSTVNCSSCPQSAGLWKRELNRSAPDVFGSGKKRLRTSHLLIVVTIPLRLTQMKKSETVFHSSFLTFSMLLCWFFCSFHLLKGVVSTFILHFSLLTNQIVFICQL